MIENYKSIKDQLNKNIEELASKKEHVLMDDEEKDREILRIITESDTFTDAITSAKEKLVVASDDADFEFCIDSREKALDLMVYIVAISRGLADPDYHKSNHDTKEEKELYETKSTSYCDVYVQIGEECVKELEREITREINNILSKCGMPRTWFQYVAASLLGRNYLNFHICVQSEHAERLKVTDVKRGYIALKVYKGIKKEEYCDCWKAFEDYLTHNIPKGLVRVEDEGTKLYNEKINGVKTSVIQKSYRRSHPSSTEFTTQRNALKLVKKRQEYRTIKPY